MTTPVITAIAIIFLVYGIIAILLDKLVKSNRRFCYFVIHSVLLIICFLLSWHFWSALVYACDRDSPYKKIIASGNVDIQVIIDSNAGNTLQFGKGCIVLLKKPKDIFLIMWPSDSTTGEQLGNNQKRFRATFELDKMDKMIGEPIHSLSKAEFIGIRLDTIPQKSKVVGGLVVYMFNGSVPIKIPIPSQMMQKDEITIPITGKYFKGN